MEEYASFARLYDPVIGPFLRSVHSAMANALIAHGGNTVVDLCCGTGLFSGIAAAKGLIPTGVDLSPDMLGVARRKYPAITFIECDATNLPCEDNSFDGVTVSFGLHEKPEAIAQAILREGVRVTRPGGVVVVADYRVPEYSRSPISDYSIRLVEWLAGREHHRCFKAYMSDGGSASFLERAGVTGELVRTFMSGRAGLYVAPVA